MLRGRRAQLDLLDDMVDAIRAGQSRSLVVCGEAGIGKTALLDYAAQAASGCRTIRIAGVESEAELAFAGLHQLCRPVMDRMDRLPTPQRAALSGAFGLTTEGSVDRFRVALAVLGLLSDIAEERALLCVIDDAQWLDQASAQALGFVARRLGMDSVGLLFAMRDPGTQPALAGLPELPLTGLSNGDSRELLASVLPAPVDERILNRIIGETRGNPLAIVELARSVVLPEFAGGFALPHEVPLASQIEQSFQVRLRRLPEDTQRLLLVAAAEPVGDPALLWRAAEILAIDPHAVGPAEAEDLLRVGPTVTFRHPLVRSAVYRSASQAQRRAAHLALSQATDKLRDPDRHAWHRASATLAPDEDVAGELERSAQRAQARGGLAAAAAFIQRAAALTPDPAKRASRTLAAARANLQSGAADRTLELLSMAESGPLTELEQAQLVRLRGQLAFHVQRGGDAPPLLLEAARRLDPLDRGLARETLLEALRAVVHAGRSGSRQVERLAAEAALAQGPPPEQDRAVDLLLRGLATRSLHGYAASVPILRQAVAMFERGDVPVHHAVAWSWLAVTAAGELFDEHAWYAIVRRHVELCREAGALSTLPFALDYLACLKINDGDLAGATLTFDESRNIQEATGGAPAPYGPLLLASWRGQKELATDMRATIERDAIERNEGRIVTALEYFTALLHNGLGEYDIALSAARRAGSYDEWEFGTWMPFELVEAAARVGDHDLAAATAEEMTRRAQAAGTPLALGVAARCRALVNEGPAAERYYLEAIEQMGRCPGRVNLARTRLVYGEWLRRERRRTDARVQLRIAHEEFRAMGVGGFARRAERELLAAGEKARKRNLETANDLTAQETRIAELARDGLSNADIAARLFISPRTVEYHLHKVYAKLAINSRVSLRGHFPKT